MSQKEDQTIDGEGDAVMQMHLPALSDEYEFCISDKGENGPELRQARGQSVCDVAGSFRHRKLAADLSRGLRGGWSLDSGAMCPLTGKKRDLAKEAVQKKS